MNGCSMGACTCPCTHMHIVKTYLYALNKELAKFVIVDTMARHQDLRLLQILPNVLVHLILAIIVEKRSKIMIIIINK